MLVGRVVVSLAAVLAITVTGFRVSAMRIDVAGDQLILSVSVGADETEKVAGPVAPMPHKQRSPPPHVDLDLSELQAVEPPRGFGRN
jgi:hypothetical protein